jgi:hypothetical protein
VKLWFAKEENRNWFLVFGNVSDLKGLGVQKFIPEAPHGRIIMESRRPECADSGIGLEVAKMLDEEGNELLLKTTD